METIYKYEGKIGIFELEMPKGAKILSCQMQKDILCIWALVDKFKSTKKSVFNVYGTGLDIDPTDKEYISTVQNGPFVWHIFRDL